MIENSYNYSSLISPDTLSIGIIIVGGLGGDGASES